MSSSAVACGNGNGAARCIAVASERFVDELSHVTSGVRTPRESGDLQLELSPPDVHVVLTNSESTSTAWAWFRGSEPPSMHCGGAERFARHANFDLGRLARSPSGGTGYHCRGSYRFCAGTDIKPLDCDTLGGKIFKPSRGLFHVLRRNERQPPLQLLASATRSDPCLDRLLPRPERPKAKTLRQG